MSFEKTIIVEGEGIALDELLFNITQREDVENLVLDANPELSESLRKNGRLSPILPVGTIINIPNLPTKKEATTKKTVNLWQE